MIAYVLVRAQRKENDFMYRKILKEALPTVLSFTMSGMYSVVDGIFVGKAAGDTGLAAINIAWPIPALITALGIGIGTGGSVLYSNYKGRGDKEQCGRIYDCICTMLLATGILITVLLFAVRKEILSVLGAEGNVYAEAIRYADIVIKGSILQVLGTGMMPLLRNMNMSFGAMISMGTGFLVNIAVNYYLMFERHMGIRGAAIGTVTAQAVVLTISIVLLFRTGYRRIRFCKDRRIMLQTIQIGITAFGMSLAPTAALIFTNLQCLRYGGEAAVACYAVISYIVFPVQSFLGGIGDGVQPLLSFYYGAGKEHEIRQIRRAAYGSVWLLGAAAMGVSIFLTGAIGRAFGLSDSSRVYFQNGMHISAAAFLLIGTVKFNISYLNATLKAKRAILLTYLESLLISPLCLVILPVIFGINGIWSALPCTAAVMLGIYFMLRKGITYEKENSN